ncbi:MAG: O-sialoglycoprotein endopeptidase [Parcubacteria group bacterium LiPW_39]|nr:MAG: O-sialoglycoprotein endopeptidase [Parcubacteria group bacterium LiPW_39]
MRILAIETSCDDTGIAILEINPGGQPKMLADLVSSQVKIHAPWGGVVPMLAKREHQRNLLPLLTQALKENKLLKISKSEFLISKQISNSKFQTLKTILWREEFLLKKLLPFLKKYRKPKIDLIAVTVGPGLEPALWVGVNFARALAYLWHLPVIPVNHIEGHIAANFFQLEKISGKSKLQITNYKLLLPAICLVVSGGHTQLILMRQFGQYQILGETRDDAAGEAFDKVAKMLNLGYPGGPIIAKMAMKINPVFNTGQKSPASPSSSRLHWRDKAGRAKIKNITFPRPMIQTKDYDFSFSGLKTAVLYFVKTLSPAQLKKLTPAIAAEFQQAVIDVLTAKTLAAAKKYHAKTVMLSGGVAANDALRETLKLEILNLKLNFLVPPKSFCTDNAAMIGLTAYHRIGPEKLRRKKSNWRNIKADANLTIA